MTEGIEILFFSSYFSNGKVHTFFLKKLRITKDDKSMSKVPKPKPNMRKLWKPNNNVFLNHELRLTVCPTASCLMEPTV